MNKLFKGENLQYKLTIVDQQSTAVDLSTLTGIFISIYPKKYKSPFARYAWPTHSGFGEITIDDPTTGEANIEITPSQTANAPIGELVVEVKLIDANGKATIEKGILGELLDSVTKELQIS